MATMFVRHTVPNYQTRRKVYDALLRSRRSKGVTAQAVYQAADKRWSRDCGSFRGSFCAPAARPSGRVLRGDGGASATSSKPANCLRRSTAGSPRASIRLI